MSEQEPLDVRTSDAVFDDLRARLRATRWPDTPAGADWGLGVDLDVLRGLVQAWIGTDLRARDDELARLPHRRMEVGGLAIHYLHARAESGHGIPLLLAHGWPDSSWRYLDVLPLLADGFDVIVPDMPGFGRSQIPDPALDSPAVAELWAELMGRLGHERFLAAGGDIGSHVVRYLALNHPDRVVAVHRMDAGLPAFDGDPAALSPEEREWIAAVGRWGAVEGAYAAMHRTKPQTAAVGLTDSPAGLAAWIVEKLHGWTDRGVGPGSDLPRERILDLLTEYWVTGTIGSSMRMYAANAALPAAELNRRVEVPSGFSLFRGDLTLPPRAWLDRMADTRFVRVHDRGGHFAPVEQPEAYAADLREFFAPHLDALR